VRILGCGASPGVPRIGNDWGACDPKEPRNRRSRCAILLEQFQDGVSQPTRVLVDTGPDMREQLLAADVGSIDAVVYTHSHADHSHGIDDLRAFWLKTRVRVPVYSDDVTRERLEEAFAYCFKAPPGGFYPAILDHRVIAHLGAFEVDGAGGPMTILPFDQNHGDSISLGLRVGPVAYSSDVSDLPSDSVDHLAGLDTWIVDALRYQPHPSHFSVDDALAWINRVNPRHAVLTHLHGDLDYKTLSGETPSNVAVAYDGMSLEFPING
jgi:phosphoribosyl 1,2-cyclic phosphate phosphodiesterase